MIFPPTTGWMGVSSAAWQAWTWCSLMSVWDWTAQAAKDRYVALYHLWLYSLLMPFRLQDLTTNFKPHGQAWKASTQYAWEVQHSSKVHDPPQTLTHMGTNHKSVVFNAHWNSARMGQCSYKGLDKTAFPWCCESMDKVAKGSWRTDHHQCWSPSNYCINTGWGRSI